MLTEDITVLIPTRNRAAALDSTLEAMTRVRRDGMRVSFVVVDNGSTDQTPSVLQRFRSRLPLVTLRAPVAGKSRALNHALRRVALGGVVVFTDDDITPEKDWFEAILKSCRRWPMHDVFGGVIEPAWPDGWSPPDWARQEAVQVLAFARHTLGDQEGEYPADVNPFGGNFWVRGSALQGLRFEERVGAHPTRQRLGDETQFVLQLRRRGSVPIHTPNVRVVHRIAASRTTKGAVYRRALQGGLGTVYVRGFPDVELFHRSRSRWRVGRVREMGARIRRFLPAILSPDETFRVRETIAFIWKVSENAQALRLSFLADAALMDWISASGGVPLDRTSAPVCESQLTQNRPT